MLLLFVSVSCLAFGLYAGKRRAVGMGWHEIACEVAVCLCGLVKKAWQALSWPFAKDKTDGSAGDGEAS